MMKKNLFFYVLILIHGLYVVAADMKPRPTISISELQLEKTATVLLQKSRISADYYLYILQHKETIMKSMIQSISQNKNLNKNMEALILGEISILPKLYIPKREIVISRRNSHPKIEPLPFIPTVWGNTKLSESR